MAKRSKATPQMYFQVEQEDPWLVYQREVRKQLDRARRHKDLYTLLGVLILIAGCVLLFRLYYGGMLVIASFGSTWLLVLRQIWKQARLAEDDCNRNLEKLDPGKNNRNTDRNGLKLEVVSHRSATTYDDATMTDERPKPNRNQGILGAILRLLTRR